MADRKALAVLGGLLVFASCFSVMAAVEDRVAFPQPATAYDFSKIRREKLRRGVVAFRSGEREAVVTWRYRLQDPTNLAFNVYRDGVRLNSRPLTGATFYKDASFDPAKGGLYSVRPVLGRRESQNPARGWRVPPSAPIGYIPLKVFPPPPWRNPDEPEHAPYPYLANDCTIGDLDGDGEFELVVKWNAFGRDNAHFGRTAPEFLTVFSGRDGRVLASIPYDPPFGDGSKWSSVKRDRHNRGFRFLSCVAYLDGVRPSLVMCRGYYDRSVITAWDWDGRRLTRRWQFDSWKEPWKSQGYSGQGNHNLRVGDVDMDGRDEIVYGQMVVDDDGRGLYTTRLGHGDAINLIQLSPDHRGLQVWSCLEAGDHGLCLREAGTGKVLKRVTSFRDTPRALAADIDPEFPGTEFWGPVHEGFYTADMEGRGRRHKHHWPGQSFLVWWTGDMTRSWLCGNRIGGYSASKGRTFVIRELAGGCSNNGSKDNPCFSGDLLGDWREEVILRNAQDPTELRLYVSDIPTEYRFWTFLQDPVYRISLATEPAGYNQPPQPGFYFGRDLLRRKTFFRGEKIP